MYCMCLNDTFTFRTVTIGTIQVAEGGQKIRVTIGQPQNGLDDKSGLYLDNWLNVTWWYCDQGLIVMVLERAGGIVTVSKRGRR
jgi:hypothetical protein